MHSSFKREIYKGNNIMLSSRTVVELFKNQIEADRVVADLGGAGISGGSIKTVDSGELEVHEEF